jgi:Fe-S cluster assembly scaffold protein SufB
MIDQIEKNLLKEIADLHGIPSGAYNIRKNGETESRAVTGDVTIETKTDKPGIDVYVRAGAPKQSIHIPVIISKSGLEEVVYNDFHIGEGADVVIIAGCGIHNNGACASKHDGIHTFYLAKNSKVTYVEKHYGDGEGTGEKIMNPQTVLYLDENAYLEMNTTQIKGVDSTDRVTTATLGAGASVVVSEKIMTHGKQYARTEFKVDLNGEGSSAHVVSRSVAKDQSVQLFDSLINGNSRCAGHTECDAIVMDDAKVSAIPRINANHVDAALVHEAVIGKIAGEQLIKFMTLGLSEKEAEEQIVSGFLK